MPRLAVVPHAGTRTSVLIGTNGSGVSSFDVIPVDDAELGDDIHGWLAKTTSGDPIGESVLARTVLPTMPTRRFMMEYGDVSAIHVAIRASTEALLEVEVSTQAMQALSRDVPFPALDMVVHPHAANLVSFCFKEFVGRLAE